LTDWVNVQHAETISSRVLTLVYVLAYLGSVTVKMTVKTHLMNKTAVSSIIYICSLFLERVSIDCFAECCTSYSESACLSVRR